MSNEKPAEPDETTESEQSEQPEEGHPADPNEPDPAADDTPAVCPVCFPLGMPEGAHAVGCEHS